MTKNELLTIKEELNSLNTEYEVAVKTLEISESVAGLMLLIIPKLIALILAIVQKIFYILTIPVVVAIIGSSKNIRITGKKLFKKETTLREVSKSIDMDSIRAAAASLSPGDGASVVRAINTILENAANESKKEYMDRIEEGDYKEAIDAALAKYMSKVETEMNSASPSMRGAVNFKNQGQLKDLIVEDYVFGPDKMNLYCIPIMKEDLAYMRREIHRYTMDDMDKAVEIIDAHIRDLETFESPDLLAHVRDTMNNPDKIFEEFYKTMHAKMKRMHLKLNMFDPHLFKDSYTARGDNEISNNLRENEEGDFMKRIQPMNLAEILKTIDLKDLGTSTLDVFEYFAAANTMPDKELNKRRDDLTKKFKEFEERIQKSDGRNYDGGFPEKYVKASLEFIRIDLLNRFHTITSARIYIHEILDDSEDIITDILTAFGDTIMTFIIDDMEHKPEAYNTTKEELKKMM